MSYKWKPWRNRDARDGLSVNTVQEGLKVSRWAHSFTLYDDDKISLDDEHNFKHVSIAKRVGKINRYKSYRMNGCKPLIAGRS